MVGRVTLNGWKREKRPIASRSGHFLQTQRDPICKTEGIIVKVLRDEVGAISAEPYSTSKHALAYQTLPLALIKLDLFMGGFSVDCRVWHPMPFSIIMAKLHLPPPSKASTLFITF